MSCTSGSNAKKFEGIWPRHLPKGLEFGRAEYLQIKRRANLARNQQRNYRGAFWHNARIYLPVALSALLLYAYLLFVLD